LARQDEPVYRKRVGYRTGHVAHGQIHLWAILCYQYSCFRWDGNSPQLDKEIVSRHPFLGFGGFLLLIVAYTVPVYLSAHPVSMLKTKSICGWERAGYLALYFFLSAGLYICTFALSLWLYGPTEMSS